MNRTQKRPHNLQVLISTTVVKMKAATLEVLFETGTESGSIQRDRILRLRADCTST
jgi:hypothetical protein